MLSVPKEHVQYFKTLLDADPATLAELPPLLAQGSLAWSVTDFGERLVQDSGVDERLARSAVIICTSLFATAESSSLARDSLVEAVLRGLGTHVELEKSSDEWSRLAGFMHAVLESPGNLDLTRKVALVGIEHAHVYIEARIFTDVRPIFSVDGLEIATSVLVHSLGITTHETGGEHRTTYIAMDRGDLLKLRDVVGRALKKDAAVRKGLAPAGWSVVEPAIGESDDG